MGGNECGGSRAYRIVILVLWAYGPSTRIIYARLYYRHSFSILIGACRKPTGISEHTVSLNSQSARLSCRSAETDGVREVRATFATPQLAPPKRAALEQGDRLRPG